MPNDDLSFLASQLTVIRGRAKTLDRSGMWPADDLAELAALGAMRWAVPREFGGLELSPLEIHLRYEAIASASLATALVLSQRDSAAGFLIGAEDWPKRSELLARLAGNEIFSTIGIAQLTTSRQGGSPALRATATASGYRLDGFIPWSTGPAESAVVIAGATVEGGGQILFALPMDAAGITVRQLPLVALASSHTAQIDCDDVHLDRQWILRGPVASALAGRNKGIALGQAYLAMGLCRGAMNLIAAHDSDRARAIYSTMDGQLMGLRAEVLSFAGPAGDVAAAEAGPRIRGAVNDLTTRCCHAAVALYKGTALRLDQPPQRLAREAMFLLVWSCPDPVISCTVDLLARA